MLHVNDSLVPSVRRHMSVSYLKQGDTLQLDSVLHVNDSLVPSVRSAHCLEDGSVLSGATGAGRQIWGVDKLNL